MESNHDGSWVEERVAQLGPDDVWQPDTDQALARLNRRRSRPAARRWVIASSLALCVSIGLLAFPAPRVFAERCVDACQSFFLPKTVAMGIGVSKPAPDFTLTDATGAALRLSDYKGKVVLLNFWATWCLPCKTEIPWFMEFERKYPGLAVMGVSMDEDGWKAVRPYLDAHKVSYRVAVDDGTMAAKYGGVDSLPETLLIGRDGRVIARHVGLVSRSDYEREIAGLLPEK
jgi:thiol-disulfide isomerase/thioredoxin